MLDSVKRTAMGAAAALAIAAPGTITPLPAAAAPLAGEGSVAAIMHNQAASAVTDVRWRRHFWGPGAFVAGATLGVLGAALAAPAYAAGYCGPYYYGYCGPYYNDYYAYYPGPVYGYGYYHPWRHHYWHNWRRW